MITRNSLRRANTKGNEVWVGLFAVTGERSNIHLDGCLGAYVTVLSPANNEAQFRTHVEMEAKALGLNIDEMVWSMTLRAKLKENEIDEYLKRLAAEVEAKGQTKFGIFHAWEH